MLIFVLPLIGRATVPKEPKANTLFLEKSSFTGAIPFEIPHSSSPWKPRESGETAPPGPTIRALKRATLRERGWKWLIFLHWTHPGLEAPGWKWQHFCFSGLCLCKPGLMPSGGDILEDGPCSLGKSCLDSMWRLLFWMGGGNGWRGMAGWDHGHGWRLMEMGGDG